MTRNAGFVGALCFILLSGTACGGDGDGLAPTARETTAAETETPEGEDEVSACIRAPHDGKRVRVIADDFFFKPKRIEVKAGRPVTIAFSNEGGTPHSFTLKNGECDTEPIFGSESIEATFEMTAEVAKFFCTVHPNMTGEVRAR